MITVMTIRLDNYYYNVKNESCTVIIVVSIYIAYTQYTHTEDLVCLCMK